MSDRRTQSVGHGIRVDHRSICRASHPRCNCPMSWWEPQIHGARKRRSGFVGTLTEAKAYKSAAKLRSNAATPVEPRIADPGAAESPTLYEFAKARLGDTLARRQITTAGYECAYRIRIHPKLGAYRLDELAPALVREWCDELVRLEGDRVCALLAYKTLCLLLSEAVDEGLLTFNPAVGIKFRRRARQAVRAGAPSATQFAQRKPALNRPQYEQFKAYAATVGLRELVMVRLAVEGALRRNELLGLRWSGYDRAARTFAITEGVTYTAKTGTAACDPKTAKSNRLIVLSRDLCEVLDMYRATRPDGADDEHYVIAGFERYTRVPDPTRPLNPDAASKQTIALIRDAGLVDENGKHYTDMQGLRATGSSIADAAGVPRSIVEAQLGHSGQTTFERHYRDVDNAPERFLFADVFERPADRDRTSIGSSDGGAGTDTTASSYDVGGRVT